MSSSILWKEISRDLSKIKKRNSAYKEETKENFRQIQFLATKEARLRELQFMSGNALHLKRYFVNGKLIDPNKIEPILLSTQDNSEYEDLFKAATLFWSVPLSKGYGRRMRFLIMDKYHQSLIGILSIMDPVFNLSTRDNWIGWDLKQKYKRLKSVMDCNVLGAVPPYNGILGGKLVASLAFSTELRKQFSKKYAGTISTIARKKFDGKLALLTVTSALGRSSIYNRVSLPWGQKVIPVGYTQGYGVFQIPSDVFLKIREAMTIDNHPYASGFKFGNGPSWKMRVLRFALHKIGHEDILNHGIKREVFMMPLGEKSTDFLNNESSRLFGYKNTVAEISEFWKNRWLLPRLERMPDALNVDGKEMYLTILTDTVSSTKTVHKIDKKIDALPMLL